MKIRRNNDIWLKIIASQTGALLLSAGLLDSVMQECILQDRLRCAAALEAEGHFAAAVVVMKTRHEATAHAN
jgi:hypothetical protein